jgi:hypothetical protein
VKELFAFKQNNYVNCIQPELFTISVVNINRKRMEFSNRTCISEFIGVFTHFVVLFRCVLFVLTAA